MARLFFSCLLFITLCVLIQSSKAENHNNLSSVEHYNVPGQSPITEDNDEESESLEIKSSSSLLSKLSPTKSFQSNGTPENVERIVPAERNQNNVSTKKSNLGGLPKSRNSRNSNDNNVISLLQPGASYLTAYPNFQQNNVPTMPNYGANPFGSLFSGPFSTPFSSPFAMRGLMTNPLSNGGFGGMGGGKMLVLRKCCDNFNNCRMLKEDEVCGPKIQSSPPSLSSSLRPSPFRVLDSYDSSGNVDHERDENIFPESLNREDNSNDIGLENRNSKPQNMQLSNFPFNFFKKQMVNGGSQNTNLLSIRRCCVNGQCLILLPDEQCGDAKFMEKLKSKLQSDGQSEDDGMSNFKNMMNGNLKQLEKMPFRIVSDSDDVDDDDNIEIPQSGKQNKAPSRPKKQFENGQSNIPANRMDSYDDMMKQFMQSNPTIYSKNDQSKGNGINPYANKQNKSRKHPYVECKDFTKDKLQQIRKQVLDKTNAYRRKHGVTPLKMDENLNNYAQEWANTLKGQGIQHRTDNLYGENIYKSSDGDNIGQQAVNAWYNELALYNLNDGEEELYGHDAIHHMTQLLWKTSQKLGVGVAKDNSGYIVVANYNPPGNVKPYFIDNLPTFTESQINSAKKAVKRANNRKVKWVHS